MKEKTNPKKVKRTKVQRYVAVSIAAGFLSLSGCGTDDKNHEGPVDTGKRVLAEVEQVEEEQQVVKSPAELALERISVLDRESLEILNAVNLNVEDLDDYVTGFMLQSESSNIGKKKPIMAGPINYFSANRDEYIRLRQYNSKIKSIDNSTLVIGLTGEEGAALYDEEILSKDHFIPQGTKVFFERVDKPSRTVVFSSSDKESAKEFLLKFQLLSSSGPEATVTMQVKKSAEMLKDSYFLETQAERVNYSLSAQAYAEAKVLHSLHYN